MSGNGPTELSSDIRQAASALRQIFVALMAEGFSEQQALVIVGHVLAAQNRPPE